ncbi:MAG: putative DNA binding domain-containing protein [Bacillota bacterium]|nr:putative DNA binding domain-containing protein [Bacillota bacterium]
MRRLEKKESITVEFKSDKRKISDHVLIEAVVAMANTDGGEIYLGVEDDGEVTGLHEDHLDPTILAAFIANKTVPPVSVRAEVLEYDKPVLKLTVARSIATVATSGGKMLRRRIKADGTPESIPLYPYEIATRLSHLRLLDLSAQPVPGAQYRDLDPVERERLRNTIRSYRGEQSLLSLTDTELDKALRLAATIEEKLVPTLAGLLLIGRADRIKELVPTAEAAIQVLEGTKVVANESFILPLLAAFERIYSHIEARNSEAEMEIGLFRVSIPDIDRRAFREALVNAFCHRDYSILGRTIIKLNDEGLTVSNPGGFIEGISLDHLLEAEPHGRNPVLADALKRIGLAERAGRGIDRIFEGSLLYGRLLPDYSESTAQNVKLFVPKGLPDKSFIKMIAEEQERTGRALSIYALLVLNALKYMQRGTVEDISSQTIIAPSRVRTSIEGLVTAGLVEAVGTGRSRSYMLSPRVYERSSGMVGYVRQTDIDDIRSEELVLKLASTQGCVRRRDVVELLRIEPPRAYRLLRKLVDAGKLELEGSGRAASYRVKT